MNTQAKVPDRLATSIRNQPETGMGYSVGDLLLKDGRVITRVVIDSGFIVSVDRRTEITFNPEEIESFMVTHDRTAVVRKK